MLFTPFTGYLQFDGEPPQPTWTVHGSNKETPSAKPCASPIAEALSRKVTSSGVVCEEVAA
jgi:hypothetical protein